MLVTGSSGLLGAELVRMSILAGHDVYAGYHEHLPRLGKSVRLNLINLNEIDAILQKYQPEVVIHAAAVTDVDLCEEKPDFARLVNGEATRRIGETAGKAGVYVIYVSTDYIFDGTKGAYSEDDKPHPINFYGESKLLGEELLRTSGAEYAIARTSVLYGWGREHKPNFAMWVLDRLRSNQSFNVVIDQVASPTFNHSLAEMLLGLAEKRTQGIFHLAGSTGIDRYNFALQIAQTFCLDSSQVKPVLSSTIPWKARRPSDSSLNVDKASRLLTAKPLNLHESLEQFRADMK